MIVRDLMTVDVVSVSPKDSIEKVASILTEKRIHGVPVIDDGKLVGIITETDFFIKNSLNFHLPSYIDFIKRTKFSGKLNREEKEKISDLLDSTANDIMSKNCIVVFPDDNIESLLSVIKERHIHTVPVVDHSGVVVGIVTRADLLKMINLN